MAQSHKKVRLAGAPLTHPRHACAFFRTVDEADRVLLPFVQDGFEQGDRAFHIVDPAVRDEHLRRLEQVGIDVAAAQLSGQLEVRTWDDAYWRGGRFDKDAMLELIQAILENGKALGFPLTRLMAQVAWALEDRPGVDDLVEYEAQLNYLLPRYDDVVI